MKKGIKRSLATAAVCAVIGVTCLAISLPFGGRAQAAEIVEKFGAPIRLNTLLDNAISKVSSISVENVGTVKTGKNVMVIAKGKDIKDVELEIGAVELVIEKSSDKNISYKADDSVKASVDVNGNDLEIKAERKEKSLTKLSSAEFVLYLPDDMNIDNLKINAGATSLECNLELDCDKLAMNVGAAEMDFNKEVSVDKANITVGAGSVNFDKFIAKEADMEVGMGQIQLNGDIKDALDLKCSMGNVNMSLTSDEDDHDYEYNVGMGTLNIGSITSAGASSERKIDNDSSSKYKIELGMGSVNINFD